MVEIQRTQSEDSVPSSTSGEEEKYRLLYSKSKVYVNPTAYARDNIPGFVALVKRVRFYHYGSSSSSLIPFRYVGGCEPYVPPRMDSGESA
jgi:hypothetical protein